MNHRVLKYILDIESVIEEIEEIKKRVGNNFNEYKADFLIRRATERELEIIGEAVRKLLETETSIKLEHSAKIIGLRNIISHAYDSVDDELIWSIIQKNIPSLQQEILELRNLYI